VDRRTKERRRIRGGDMAILCPTHKMLTDYASVLRSQGMRVRIQEDGWYLSRVVQIIWHALAYVANPADHHAALYLAVTELGSLGLDEALHQLPICSIALQPCCILKIVNQNRTLSLL